MHDRVRLGGATQVQVKTFQKSSMQTRQGPSYQVGHGDLANRGSNTLYSQLARVGRGFFLASQLQCPG